MSVRCLAGAGTLCLDMDPTGLLDLAGPGSGELRRRAARLTAVAGDLRRAAARLDSGVRSLPYEGQGARAFRDRMAHRHLEALRIAGALEDAAGRLVRASARLGALEGAGDMLVPVADPGPAP